MSEALFGLGGLRFWCESEIEARELFQARMVGVFRRTLMKTNPAWKMLRCEGPILHPRAMIGLCYGESDVFTTQDVRGDDVLCLRAETTPSSYLYAKFLRMKLPLCVWQSGLSARRELNDGASASKLRFNVFWQLEFQCIYSCETKADYRAALIPVVQQEIQRMTMAETRVQPSERIPAYAESTIDIEAQHGGTWREMASCSIRTDYSDDTRVCEIAVGLDRVATLADGGG